MVINKEKLGRMKNEKEILNTLQIKKKEYLGHVMRGKKHILFCRILNKKT